MLCIADSRMPEEAKSSLSKYAEVVEFFTEDIVYESISGHPDIFFCKTGDIIITASNLPRKYRNILTENGVKHTSGENLVNETYPASAVYNAVCSDCLFIHRLDITDPVLLSAADSLQKINVRQGYTRCSLLPLPGKNFITSDPGIFKVLNNNPGLTILNVKPDRIILPGFSYGFFGGACGIYENTVFICGSLSFFPEGTAVRDFLDSRHLDIVELYEGPLIDVGSILLIKNNVK